MFFNFNQYFGKEKLPNKCRKPSITTLCWVACLGCCPGEVLLQKTHKLVVDFSYLHVYSVGFLPTRLLISKDYSHLHVYLVSTFIQQYGVPDLSLYPCHDFIRSDFKRQLSQSVSLGLVARLVAFLVILSHIIILICMKRKAKYGQPGLEPCHTVQGHSWRRTLKTERGNAYRTKRSFKRLPPFTFWVEQEKSK